MDDDVKLLVRATIPGLIALVALILLICSCFMVDTRQIGVETLFGRPTGKTYANGFHTANPFSSIAQMDGAVQIDKYTDDHAIKVRLGNNSVAGADTSIRWQIKQNAASELYMAYKGFDNVRINLIERNLQVSLNEIFQSFDPLASKWEKGVPLQDFANKAADHLRQSVGDQVDILDVSVSRLDYDGQTEAKINQLNAERAATAVAEQAGKTAEAQRIANERLAGSVSNDPNVIVAHCVDKALDKGVSVFGCWPSAAAVPTIPTK